MGRWLFLISLGVGGYFLFHTFVAEGVLIASGSMEPTLTVGRHIFANKMVYKFRKPRRGEIIVFSSPVEDKELVKRVIAVEGDEVRLEKKKVFLNGRLLEEPYVQYTRPNEILDGDNLDVGRVPSNCIFVLGDNRDQSGDSQDWIEPQTGKPLFFIRVNDIKGKLLGE